jgi:hypothetical protein
MDGEGSDKEKNLSSSEEKEDKEEEPGEESTFFLITKEPREDKEKENVKEGTADKERNISAAFFIPGADTEIKGRLKD